MATSLLSHLQDVHTSLSRFCFLCLTVENNCKLLEKNSFFQFLKCLNNPGVLTDDGITQILLCIYCERRLKSALKMIEVVRFGIQCNRLFQRLIFRNRKMNFEKKTVATGPLRQLHRQCEHTYNKVKHYNKLYRTEVLTVDSGVMARYHTDSLRKLPTVPSLEGIIPKHICEENPQSYPYTQSNSFLYQNTLSDPLKYPNTPSDPLKYPNTPSEPLKYPNTPADSLKYPNTPADPLQYPNTPADPFQQPFVIVIPEDIPANVINKPELPQNNVHNDVMGDIDELLVNALNVEKEKITSERSITDNFSGTGINDNIIGRSKDKKARRSRIRDIVGRTLTDDISEISKAANLSGVSPTKSLTKDIISGDSIMNISGNNIETGLTNGNCSQSTVNVNFQNLTNTNHILAVNTSSTKIVLHPIMVNEDGKCVVPTMSSSVNASVANDTIDAIKKKQDAYLKKLLALPSAPIDKIRDVKEPKKIIDQLVIADSDSDEEWSVPIMDLVKSKRNTYSRKEGKNDTGVEENPDSGVNLQHGNTVSKMAIPKDNIDWEEKIPTDLVVFADEPASKIARYNKPRAPKRPPEVQPNPPEADLQNLFTPIPTAQREDGPLGVITSVYSETVKSEVVEID